MKPKNSKPNTTKVVQRIREDANVSKRYKPKISVIIPVFNAEETVGTILEKLLIQQYNNIEIIVVNDGSKDDSLKILQNFAAKDNRVVLIDQKNAGASAARNVAIQKSSGEFITFIDSDDDIDEKLLIELASGIKPTTDFVVCGMNINEKKVTSPSIYLDEKLAITKYVLKSLLTKNLLYGPCCKLFRKGIISEFNIFFPEDVNYGEDTIFVLGYLKVAKNIRVLEKALYCYNYRQDGLAKNNNGNFYYRKSRSKALRSYALCDDNSTKVFWTFLLIELRWSMAYMKSKIRKYSV